MSSAVIARESASSRAPVNIPRLDHLPTELLLRIVSYLQVINNIDGIVTDLASLALVNQQLHGVFDSILWDFGGKNLPYNLPVQWAAARNRTDILVKALGYQLPLGSCSRIADDPIHFAAKYGHNAALSWLIDHGVPIDHSRAHQDHASRDFSPLYTALESGRESTAMLLLSRGAKFRFTRGLRYPLPLESGLHMAAEHRLLKVVKYLAKASRIDVNEVSISNETPLHSAVKTEHNERIIRVLLRLGADINAERGLVSPPLTTAIMFGQFGNAIILLDAGADVNPRYPNGARCSPLIECTRAKPRFGSRVHDDLLPQQNEVLRKLIANGANLDTCIGSNTALTTAIEKGTVQTVFELLKAGADIQKPKGDDFYTPSRALWATVEQPGDGFSHKASLLVAAGIRIDAPDPGSLRSLLDRALEYCAMGSPRPLKALLQSATTRNVDSASIDFLFDKCLVDRHREPAEVLMNYGATSERSDDIAYSWASYIIRGNQFDRRAFTFCLDLISSNYLEGLLYEALYATKVEHCQMLINRGAIKVSEGFRPWLHIAAERGSIPLVRRLCRAGMDLDALDEESKTPMMKATENGKVEVAELLFELGADPFYPRRDPSRPSPDAERRQLSSLPAQPRTPFEYAICQSCLPQMRRWWVKAPPELRPIHDWYCERVKSRCGISGTDASKSQDGGGLPQTQEGDMVKPAESEWKKILLTRAMEKIQEAKSKG
ncbi:ankyrin [Hypoxylon crocopeplum]|nr:ankyrin [Hypoxylon crocopeplum]